MPRALDVSAGWPSSHFEPYSFRLLLILRCLYIPLLQGPSRAPKCWLLRLLLGGRPRRVEAQLIPLGSAPSTSPLARTLGAVSQCCAASNNLTRLRSGTRLRRLPRVRVVLSIFGLRSLGLRARLLGRPGKLNPGALDCFPTLARTVNVCVLPVRATWASLLRFRCGAGSLAARHEGSERTSA
ncbi:MAG: hypothetical protein RJA70_38 [Pseudomonadota bacterium]|jgi:hypothetical protein